MATRVIDDVKLQNIAVAIQSKDDGGQMTVDEMPGRIEAIPSGAPVVLNPALILWDWEGTKLAEYSAEDTIALTELPAPSTLPAYANVDHELLLFQKWNWSLANIKTWIQNHEGETRDVGAIYTTTDGRNHNYWNNPRLDKTADISMQKRGIASIEINEFINRFSLAHVNIPDSVTSIGVSAFQNCYSLAHVNIPDGVTSIGSNMFLDCYSLAHVSIPDSVTSIGSSAFKWCYSLTNINIPDGVTNIESSVFQYCTTLCDILLESKPTLANTNSFVDLPTNYRVYVPRADLSWFETATNWSTIYTKNHIVAIEDFINYLESIGFNVDKYKEATA